MDRNGTKRAAERDSGATEPLLPVHQHGSRDAAGETANGHGTCDDSAAKRAQDDDSPAFGKSPKRMREKYLKQLGYTPLIFRVRACVLFAVVTLLVCYYSG